MNFSFSGSNRKTIPQTIPQKGVRRAQRKKNLEKCFPFTFSTPASSPKRGPSKQQLSAFWWSFCCPKTFSVPTSPFLSYHLFPPSSWAVIPPSLLPTHPLCALTPGRRQGKAKCPLTTWLKKHQKAPAPPKPLGHTDREDAQN